ncbi:ribosomal protein S30-domain-containing protein, partial [Gamsiella multidivaricata]|uniref:ribosomal protein S30-domain-containing protein n=1 Tax=Gamsiella multidivaricata TaxID=101098 RepID=UPI00221F7E23
GKVHGSLARAGKVKSQTPKVAKQEKKKKLTGRAKKRDTYKRRFVNVTNAPGGKRRVSGLKKKKKKKKKPASCHINGNGGFESSYCSVVNVVPCSRSAFH